MTGRHGASFLHPLNSSKAATAAAREQGGPKEDFLVFCLSEAALLLTILCAFRVAVAPRMLAAGDHGEMELQEAVRAASELPSMVCSHPAKSPAPSDPLLLLSGLPHCSSLHMLTSSLQQQMPQHLLLFLILPCSLCSSSATSFSSSSSCISPPPPSSSSTTTSFSRSVLCVGHFLFSGCCQ